MVWGEGQGGEGVRVRRGNKRARGGHERLGRPKGRAYRRSNRTFKRRTKDSQGAWKPTYECERKCSVWMLDERKKRWVRMVECGLRVDQVSEGGEGVG